MDAAWFFEALPATLDVAIVGRPGWQPRARDACIKIRRSAFLDSGRRLTVNRPLALESNLVLPTLFST